MQTIQINIKDIKYIDDIILKVKLLKNRLTQ